MFRIQMPAVLGRFGRLAVGVVLTGVLSAGSVYAQQTTSGAGAQGGAAPAGGAQAVSNQRLFASDGGIVLNFIKPDKTADFEMVISKLKEALSKSDKPERKEQAQGWKIFKSPDPAGQNVLYVFVIYPSAKSADYQVSNIIAEAFPTEANDILKKYAESYAQGMNIVNLSLIQDLSK